MSAPPPPPIPVARDAARPLVTTIVNSYNYERYLEQAIRSVIDQDFDDREIIVVDDGSTDGSAAIIRSFGDRIVPIFNANLGQARSCLRAIRLARGEYVHFLDSDDFLLPGAIQRFAAECVPGVAKVQFQLQPVGPDGALIGRPWPPMASATRAALLDRIARTGTYVTPPNSGNVYRADVFAHIEDIDYESSIDGVAYLLAPLLGEVRQIDAPLGCYRYHSTNFSEHGLLTAARFGLESRRHRDRLRHLSAIARADDLPIPALSDSADHCFVLTRAILATVSDGGRPGAGLCLRYLRSLRREGEPPLRLLSLGLWGLAVTIAPRRLRERLALHRSDPRSRPAIWSTIRNLKRGRAASA